MDQFHTTPDSDTINASIERLWANTPRGKTGAAPSLPESLGTRYDALSDAHCAPEGMARSDADRLPGVAWQRVDGQPVEGGGASDDADPLRFWVGLRNAFGIVATLAVIWLTLWLMFGPGGH